MMKIPLSPGVLSLVGAGGCFPAPYLISAQPAVTPTTITS